MRVDRIILIKSFLWSFIFLLLLTVVFADEVTAGAFDFPLGPGLRSNRYYILKNSTPHSFGGENIYEKDRLSLFFLLSGKEKRYVMVFGIDVMPPPNNSVGAGEYHAGEDWRLLRIVPGRDLDIYQGHKTSGDLAKGIPWGSTGGKVLIEYSYDEPVYSVAAGRVVRSFKGGPCWVNVIVIEHKMLDGKLYYSVYEHLKDRSVFSGDIVRRGQIIGRVGNPSCAGPHLHFEIRNGRKKGEAYNPADVLVGDGYLPEKNINPRGAEHGHHQVPSRFIYDHREGKVRLGEFHMLPGKKKKMPWGILGFPVRAPLLSRGYQLEIGLEEYKGRPVKMAVVKLVLAENNKKDYTEVITLEKYKNISLGGDEETLLSVKGTLPEGLDNRKAYYLLVEARVYEQRGGWYRIAFRGGKTALKIAVE